MTKCNPLALLATLSLTLVLVVGSGAHAQSDDAKGFSSLLKGDSFDGFTQRGGKAKYEVKDGVVTGICVQGEPNSFMCTDKRYANFILELEFKVDPKMNSGVQIRSHCYDEKTKQTLRNGKEVTFAAGRVHGYQVEIDPSDRRWSGGIYDEARRGWIDDLADNKPARDAFDPAGWNKYRIMCNGFHIQTWINDVPAANLVDFETAEGFIGLQVHGAYSKKEMIGTSVQWRNIRIKELPATDGTAALENMILELHARVKELEAAK